MWVPEHLSNRVARYLIQRYFGFLLEDRLALDQLNIVLNEGKAVISDLKIDCRYINERLLNSKAPVEVVEIIIREVSLSVPISASSLLQSNTLIEVSDVFVTVMPFGQQDFLFDEEVLESMFVSCFQSSIEILAQDYMKDNPSSPPQSPPKQQPPQQTGVVGLELFSQLIEALIAKVKLIVRNIVVRLDNLSSASADGIALELRIKKAQLFDEFLADVNLDGDSMPSPANTPFLNKRAVLTDIELFTDTFRKVVNNEGNFDWKSDPLKLVDLFGDQILKIQIKRDNSQPGPKVALDFELNWLNVFMTPSSLLSIERIVAAVSNSRRKSKLDDLTKAMTDAECSGVIEAQLMQSAFTPAATGLHHKSPQSTFSTATTAYPQSTGGVSVASEYFASCRDPDDMTSSVNSNFTSVSQQQLPTTDDSFRIEKEFKLRMSLHVSYISVILLQVDVASHVVHDQLIPASDVLKDVVRNYFHQSSRIERRARDLLELREDFGRISDHDQLLLQIKSIKIAMTQHVTEQTQLQDIELVARDIDFVEIPHSARRAVQKSLSHYGIDEQSLSFTELFVFDRLHVSPNEPNLKIDFSRETMRKRATRFVSLPKRQLNVKLSCCQCEIDISFYDRLHNILSKMTDLIGRSETSSHVFKSRSSQRQQPPIDLSISFGCCLMIVMRFPIPDFRVDKPREYWHRCLRSESLVFDLRNVELKSLLESGDYCSARIEADAVNVFLQEPPTRMASIAAIAADHLAMVSLTIEWNSAQRIHEKATVAADTKRSSSDSDEYRQLFDEMAQTTQESYVFSKEKTFCREGECLLPADEEAFSSTRDMFRSRSAWQFSLVLPHASIQLVNKQTLELIYNRIVNDLLLWQPYSDQSIGSTLASTLFNTDQHVFTFCSTTGLSGDAADEDGGAGMEASHAQNRKHSPISINLAVSRLTLLLNVEEEEEVKGKATAIVIQGENAELELINGLSGPNDSACYIKVANVNFYYRDGVVLADIDDSLTSGEKLSANYWVTNVYKLLLMPRHGFESSLTLAIDLKVQKPQANRRKNKSIQFVTLLSNALLDYDSKFLGLISRLLDFVTLRDQAIDGYSPSKVMSNLHCNFQSCSVFHEFDTNYSCDLRLNNFVISTNIASDVTIKSSGQSAVRFLIEDSHLLLVDRTTRKTARVADVTLLDFNLRISTGGIGNKTVPKIDLCVTNDRIDIHTCRDSFEVLKLLIIRLAFPTANVNVDDSNPDGAEEDSSVAGGVEEEEEDEEFKETLREAISEEVRYTPPIIDRHASEYRSVPLSTSATGGYGSADVENEMGGALLDLRDESVGESIADQLRDATNTVIRPTSTSVHEEECEDSDFCVIDEVGFGGGVRAPPEPVVRYLVDESNINVTSDYFRSPKGASIDQLETPGYMPQSLYKFHFRDITISWRIYFGVDFSSNESRDPENFMTFNFNKLSFASNSFHPDSDLYSRRLVLLVKDFEIVDNLKTSAINKFLCLLETPDMPRQQHGFMFSLKIHYTKTKEQKMDEASIKLSVLPLRLHIDQDALLFMMQFFRQSDAAAPNATATSSPSKPPVLRVNRSSGGSDTDDVIPLENVLFDELSKEAAVLSNESSRGSNLLFIKLFIFSPSLPIQIDYHGHLSNTDRSPSGILSGLMQLHNSRITLKCLHLQHGFTGMDRLMSHVIAQWISDIRSNQISSIIGGFGPMDGLLQIGKGVCDLVRMPYRQYKIDGRIGCGMKMGASSFTTSTATAALHLVASGFSTIQYVAESCQNTLSSDTISANQQLVRQFPPDFRSGVAAARIVVHSMLRETSQRVMVNYQRDVDRDKGAVGAIMRQVPTVVFRPVIAITQATQEIIVGITNQIQPTNLREKQIKYK